MTHGTAGFSSGKSGYDSAAAFLKALLESGELDARYDEWARGKAAALSPKHIKEVLQSSRWSVIRDRVLLRRPLTAAKTLIDQRYAVFHRRKFAPAVKLIAGSMLALAEVDQGRLIKLLKTKQTTPFRIDTHYFTQGTMVAADLSLIPEDIRKEVFGTDILNVFERLKIKMLALTRDEAGSERPIISLHFVLPHPPEWEMKAELQACSFGVLSIGTNGRIDQTTFTAFVADENFLRKMVGLHPGDTPAYNRLQGGHTNNVFGTSVSLEELAQELPHLAEALHGLAERIRS